MNTEQEPETFLVVPSQVGEAEHGVNLIRILVHVCEYQELPFPAGFLCFLSELIRGFQIWVLLGVHLLFHVLPLLPFPPI